MEKEEKKIKSKEIMDRKRFNEKKYEIQYRKNNNNKF